MASKGNGSLQPGEDESRYLTSAESQGVTCAPHRTRLAKLPSINVSHTQCAALARQPQEPPRSVLRRNSPAAHSHGSGRPTLCKCQMHPKSGRKAESHQREWHCAFRSCADFISARAYNRDPVSCTAFGSWAGFLDCALPSYSLAGFATQFF